MKSISFLFAMMIMGLTHGQVAHLSDEFEIPCSLYDWTDVSDYEGWNATHLEVKDVDVTNDGELTMMPYTTAWYQNYRSTYLFKEVSGDFTFTSQVTVTNRADDGDLPSSDFSLGGIMIRTPKDTLAANTWSAGEENYTFLSLGYARAASGPGPHFEVKNTTNSSSALQITQIDTTTVNIRLVRVNDAVLVLYQEPGEDFLVHRRYYRDDMPDTVQIGFVTYTDWPNVNGQDPFTHNSNDHTDPSYNPDIIGKFDYGRFRDISLPPWLETANFHQSGAVPNDTILEYFGYESEYTGREGWKVWKGDEDTNWNNAMNWDDDTLPIATDSIYIPNCGCTEVFQPTVSSGSYTYASMATDVGAELTVASGVNITIDLSGANAVMANEGEISNQGVFTITNSATKSMLNYGSINCIGTGSFTIEE